MNSNLFISNFRTRPPRDIASRSLFWMLRHWLAHKLEINDGMPIVWISSGKKRMTGFRCAGCGELSDIHPSKI